jgi:hypothetical protein
MQVKTYTDAFTLATPSRMPARIMSGHLVLCHDVLPSYRDDPYAPVKLVR